MPDDLAGSALEAAARLGPYFAWEPYDGAAGWRPLPELLDAGVIGERVAVGRRTLARMGGLRAGDIDERAAASIIFLGLASRLVSPPLGAAAVAGVLVTPDAGKMWWRPVEGGPLPIAWRGLTARHCDDDAAVAGELARAVRPLLEVFRARFSLSPHVLWGDVASALGGAVRMIGEPAAARRALSIVEAALGTDLLRGTATLTRPGALRRNNCCLYYRIPGAGICGDCVLTTARSRRPA